MRGQLPWLLPDPESNPFGTRFRASRKNRRKPLENGPLTRKAESIFFQLVDEFLNEELFESAAMNHERAVAWQTDHN